MKGLERFLNILFVIVIGIVLLGAFGVEFFLHEIPCPLCYLQRLGLLGAACGALMNIKFGIRNTHYGFIIIAALIGAGVSIRQILLHICPGALPPWPPLWGYCLYTWALIVFICTILAVALLLIFFDKPTRNGAQVKLNLLSTISFAFIFLMAFSNIVLSLIQCGLGPCIG